MTVNEFAKAIHENAVAHGWYDTPVDFPEVAVMVHAEISEAVEEWRGGNPLVYGTCALAAEGCKYSGVCDRVGQPGGDGVDGPCKPEGVAVELCDAVISQLGGAERDIIRLWYIEGKSKEEIAAAVNYASTRSIYDLRNSAVAEFALRYFGAGALPSV